LQAFREDLAASDGKQPRDPGRAAALIIATVNDDDSPLRLVLGEPAIFQVRAKLASIAADVERFEEVSSETAFSSD
jgi:hypothetical protein